MAIIIEKSFTTIKLPTSCAKITNIFSQAEHSSGYLGKLYLIMISSNQFKAKSNGLTW
jgi:hypothetical protein